MSGFIPPPYPFVEAWPRVFAGADQSRWLTPATALGLGGEDASAGGGAGGQWGAPPGDTGAATAMSTHYCQPPGYCSVGLYGAAEQNAGVGEDSDDDEYEYGFVLTDEWCERLVRSGDHARHHRRGPGSGSDDDRRPQNQRPSIRKSKSGKKQQQQQRRSAANNAPTAPGADNSRAEHLQRELEAAKTRELAMRWRLQRSGSAQPFSATVRRLETALTARFDEFCDAYQPVVWPHASAC